eukprot:6482133-Amphidinium_carterae.1
MSVTMLERIQFERLCGGGPDTGWVSSRLQDMACQLMCKSFGRLGHEHKETQKDCEKLVTFSRREEYWSPGRSLVWKLQCHLRDIALMPWDAVAYEPGACCEIKTW